MGCTTPPPAVLSLHLPRLRGKKWIRQFTLSEERKSQIITVSYLIERARQAEEWGLSPLHAYFAILSPAWCMIFLPHLIQKQPFLGGLLTISFKRGLIFPLLLFWVCSGIVPHSLPAPDDQYRTFWVKVVVTASGNLGHVQGHTGHVHLSEIHGSQFIQEIFLCWERYMERVLLGLPWWHSG